MSTNASSQAYNLIRRVLRSRGPCSTQSLHAHLHNLPDPLPPRSPPADFLAGANRPLQPRKLLNEKRTTTAFPGKHESSKGTWSMKYLKQELLKVMQDEGEILKITRSKWHSLVKSESRESSSNASVGEETVKSARNGSTAEKKEGGEFVWVLKSQFDQAVEGGQTPKSRIKGEGDGQSVWSQYGSNDE